MINMLNDGRTMLSDIPTGNKCVVVKVDGYGSFRHRIMELGFVKGEIVSVIKNAPLKDPIEYEVMGSHVSLRRDEAEHIEVNDISNFKPDDNSANTFIEEIQNVISKQSRIINVALVGNPNCGKTSFFNYATGLREKVGNYSGVTVTAKVGTFNYNGYTVNMVDLPGTYSITEFSPEERYVRKYIIEEHPDVVLNVVDSSNLERNLFLTTQLIDMNVRIVMALNMYDELEKSGNRLNYKYLGQMLGFNIVPTSAYNGFGINDVLAKIIDAYEDKEDTHRHIHINYGNDIENAINEIKKVIPKESWVTDHYTPRYLALELLENDSNIIDVLKNEKHFKELSSVAARCRQDILSSYKEDASTVITNAKYGFIRGALKETYVINKLVKQTPSDRIDNILTNKWLGFPILFLFLYIMFQATFSLGKYPQEWIDNGITLLTNWLSGLLKPCAMTDMLIDGIIKGVGSVLVFLPNILILFFFISIMEDTGYMARAAFIMDKLMHRIGLHGKSFIPLLIGFGCSVPAIMSTRILENKNNRILTMLIIPMMSCSARLPVYILLVSAFFTRYQALIMLSLYLIGIMFAILVALILKNTIFKGKSDQFVLELPPYRVPTFRNIGIHIWDRTAEYLKKISSVILVASIIIWALEYFPKTNDEIQSIDNNIASVNNNTSLTDSERIAELVPLQKERAMMQRENSYIGQIGHFIQPVMSPLGFDWKMSVSLFTGLAAKEVVVSSLGILYNGDDTENSSSLGFALKNATYSSGPRIGQHVFTPLIAFVFMIFVLLYFPCIAALTTIRKEYGFKWMMFVIVYTLFLAWFVSFGVFQIGRLL